MTRVNINRKLILWALDRASIDLESLATSSQFKRINEWIDGSAKPTLKQIEAFATKTHTPLGYLFLEEPPRLELNVPFFRTNGDTRNEYSLELFQQVQYMERRQNWYREYLIDQGARELKFIGSCTLETNPLDAAESILDVLNLEHNWAETEKSWQDATKKLRKHMQMAGILVFKSSYYQSNTKRSFSVSEFRGFVLVDSYAPLVFVNSGDALSARMFTLAHELAHLLLGQNAIFDLENLLASEDKYEQLCDRIAAEFLVPSDIFSKAWTTMTNLQMEELAYKFKVSQLVIARKALDLHYIDREQFFEFYNKYMQQLEELEDEASTQLEVSGKKKGGPSYYVVHGANDDRNFVSAVVRAASEGSIEYKEAYRLTGYYGSTFDNYVSNILEKSN